MTAFISHADCLLHEMGEMHPESPQRINAIVDQLIESHLYDHLDRFDAPLATREQLLRVHAESYLDSIERASPASGRVELDPDTSMNPHTLQAAKRAAGAVVLATDLVLGEQAENAFCAIRPPGHHAGRAQAMGFCIFNNLAVGVAHAIEQYGLGKVAIVDFDVHHGNGTEDIFRDEDRVMMASIFQHPFYPFSGFETRSSRMVNVPLSAGSSGAEFRRVVEEVWLPALDRFAPEMIYVSAGFDAHRDDDMALLRLADSDYFWVTQQIMRLAGRHCRGRIVSTLEGGYELNSLGRSAAQHIKALSGL